MFFPLEICLFGAMPENRAVELHSVLSRSGVGLLAASIIVISLRGHAHNLLVFPEAVRKLLPYTLRLAGCWVESCVWASGSGCIKHLSGSGVYLAEPRPL